jgi:hypothetical protein
MRASFFEGFMLGCVFVSGVSSLINLYGPSYRNSYVKMREEAVERGVAEYDESTGKWQWREEEK